MKNLRKSCLIALIATVSACGTSPSDTYFVSAEDEGKSVLADGQVLLESSDGWKLVYRLGTRGPAGKAGQKDREEFVEIQNAGLWMQDSLSMSRRDFLAEVASILDLKFDGVKIEKPEDMDSVRYQMFFKPIMEAVTDPKTAGRKINAKENVIGKIRSIVVVAAFFPVVRAALVAEVAEIAKLAKALSELKVPEDEAETWRQVIKDAKSLSAEKKKELIGLIDDVASGKELEAAKKNVAKKVAEIQASVDEMAARVREIKAYLLKTIMTLEEPESEKNKKN